MVMKKERSAGAVVFRKDKEPKYLLLHYELGHWDFPKGHIAGKETEIEALKREVEEETGITDIEIVPNFKEKIEYYYKLKGELIHKEVIFYLTKTKKEDVKISFEHIGFIWLAYDRAIKKNTFSKIQEKKKKKKKKI